MTPAQERIASEMHKPRWVQVLVPLLIVLAIAVAAGGGYYARNASNASQDVQQQGARRDCVTAYNADFTEVTRAQTNLSVALQQQLSDVLVGEAVGKKPTQAQIGTYITTSAALTEATAAVKALPKLDIASVKGFTLNGVHHPPCPGS